MDINTKGIVIKEKAIGENDKLLTILTSEHGKIHAYAKGVKKISSKNSAACQLFVYSDYEIIEKGGRMTIKTAISNELFYNMRSDMSRYSLACYFAEVINFVSTENSGEEEMLRLFLNTLFALSSKTEIPLWFIKGAFELKLMCICGYAPDFSSCCECANDTVLKRNNIFSFENASILCEKCANSKNTPFSCTVSDKTALIMAYITSAPTSKFLSVKYSSDIRLEFNFVCENYLIHKTERTYDTLRIYKFIANSLGEI